MLQVIQMSNEHTFTTNTQISPDTLTSKDTRINNGHWVSHTCEKNISICSLIIVRWLRMKICPSSWHCWKNWMIALSIKDNWLTPQFAPAGRLQLRLERTCASCTQTLTDRYASSSGSSFLLTDQCLIRGWESREQDSVADVLSNRSDARVFAFHCTLVTKCNNSLSVQCVSRGCALSSLPWREAFVWPPHFPLDVQFSIDPVAREKNKTISKKKRQADTPVKEKASPSQKDERVTLYIWICACLIMKYESWIQVTSILQAGSFVLSKVNSSPPLCDVFLSPASPLLSPLPVTLVDTHDLQSDSLASHARSHRDGEGKVSVKANERSVGSVRINVALWGTKVF